MELKENNMKLSIFAIIVFALYSCSSQKNNISTLQCVAIYKGDPIPGRWQSDYLIIRKYPNIIEKYYPSSESYIGLWEKKADTLLYYPQCLIEEKNSILHINANISKDTTICTINQKFLIRADSLIDITDYSICFQIYDKGNLIQVMPYDYEKQKYNQGCFKLVGKKFRFE